MTEPTRVLVVSPALNEQDLLPDFVSQLRALERRATGRFALRILVVDDGSTDGTLAVLRTLAAGHPATVGYVALAANAGQQAALVAGLCHAGSWPDVIVTMDADLEHPVDVILAMVDAWKSTGAAIVHTVRRPTGALPWHKRLPSAAFYRIAAAMTGLDMAPGQADFKLWDARVVRSVMAYLPHIGSLRAFAAWLPGQTAVVEYDQAVQPGRRSRFTFRKNLELASISIIRFSDLPLKAIGVLGATGLAFSLVYGSYIAVTYARGQAVPGWASTVLTMMIMGCLQLVSIGIVASYLRRLVFARDLPPFIVREQRLHE